MRNFKDIRKNFLFHSSNVFRQNVLGTITCFSCPIGKRQKSISLYHSCLRLMAGVLIKDSEPAIKAVLFLLAFFSSVFSSCLLACRSKFQANPLRKLLTLITLSLTIFTVSGYYMYKNKLSRRKYTGNELKLIMNLYCVLYRCNKIVSLTSTCFAGPLTISFSSNPHSPFSAVLNKFSVIRRIGEEFKRRLLIIYL